MNVKKVTVKELAAECQVSTQALNAFLKKREIPKIKNHKGKDIYDITPEVIELAKGYYLKSPQTIVEEECLKKQIKDKDRYIAKLISKTNEVIAKNNALENKIKYLINGVSPESKNRMLRQAKQKAYDEYYTLYEDVQNELKHYHAVLKNKKVYCNCDNPFRSNIFKYLLINFNKIGLKALYATNYAVFGETPYKAEITSVDVELKPESIDNYIRYLKANHSITMLDGDGDFRSYECLSILKQSDVIITNPPFSLMSEFLNSILDSEKSIILKDFIILGNKNIIAYPTLKNFIVSGKVKIGYSIPDKFYTDFEHSNTTNNLKNSTKWFTSFSVEPKLKKLNLQKKYTDRNDYPTLTNSNDLVIEFSKVKNIPIDYYGKIAVPLTILDYDLSDYELLGFDTDFVLQDKNKVKYKQGEKLKYPYTRLVIQKKTEVNSLYHRSQ